MNRITPDIEVNDLGSDPTEFVFGLEQIIWPLAEQYPEWRDLAFLIAEWWTVARALPMLVERADGKCECGCGETLFGICDPHHVKLTKGPFLHHPGNLALTRRGCHGAIHGEPGTGIDKERVERVRAKARERLPGWVLSPMSQTRKRKPVKRANRGKKSETLCACGCGDPLGKRTVNGYRWSCWRGQVE